MSPPTVNLAFLGCGQITRTHSRTLAGLGLGSQVRCFYASRDAAAAAAFARHYGGAGSFGSYDAALEDPRIDTVLVATPPHSHLELTLRALGRRKNVIVEKPAFLRASDFGPVRIAAAQAGCRVFVAENYCYKPIARHLRDVIASGSLGEVRFLHLNAVKYRRPGGWRGDPNVSGGGALFEGGVHWIDLLANLGLRVEAVHGFRPGDWRDPERSMLLVAEYEEGAIGTLAHSWDIPSALQGLRLSHIYGTRGSILFESNGLFILVTGAKPRLIFPGLRDISGYQAMFRDFLAALRTGSEPVMSLSRAQRAIELIEAAYRTAPSTPALEAVP
jgi:predicted dehydrogenase